ncbi:unnamed protein product [Didymodactylos carnosus]|uniref:MSP domain-containing protein n=1 Tax=Didymodactylos carnosus TaxID=1234261 RepID=A0A813NTK5_9BILA|nr:unnamed protein product [Didymodactylos carnosus]CAF0742286.1 unnamed protein product [Didymodactylos carnosus]CAF3516681.1 unnamed protein product [Didymodactylos carnosus]CAF3519884.1 unnamed protein product [Didymodactylos carnosus]
MAVRIGPFNNVSTTTLKLSNSGNERLAYKIKTTAPKRYCVKPNSGFLDPHTNTNIQVMLQPQPTGVQQDDRSKHKFMVQWVAVPPTWSEDVENFWKQEGSKLKDVQDSKLKCVFAEDQTAADRKVPNDSFQQHEGDFSGSSYNDKVTNTQPQTEINAVDKTHQSAGQMETTPTNHRSTIQQQQQTSSSTTHNRDTHHREQHHQEEDFSQQRLKQEVDRLKEENENLRYESQRLRKKFGDVLQQVKSLTSGLGTNATGKLVFSNGNNGEDTSSFPSTGPSQTTNGNVQSARALSTTVAGTSSRMGNVLVPIESQGSNVLCITLLGAAVALLLGLFIGKFFMEQAKVRQRVTTGGTGLNRVDNPVLSGRNQQQQKPIMLFGINLNERRVIIAFIIALIVGFSFGYYLFACGDH